MKLRFIILLITSVALSQSKIDIQNQIIKEYYEDCALGYNYNFQMDKWQDCLDNGLKKDSTIAKLWSEKAMPYFKCRKYEIGMKYVDKAVLYDREEYLVYRAFIKCIFSKQPTESITDYENVIKEYGNITSFDHTCKFYIAINYLQLNEFSKSEILLKEYIDTISKERGADWVSPTAYFYYGISLFEQKKYLLAIAQFNLAIKYYNTFIDAKFYKGLCYALLGNKEEYKKCFDESKKDYKAGNNFPEWNSVYETYPYQVPKYILEKE
ncbi:hypothetical protein Q361_10285 [Flavobacterium croceum DSM 17960]|uniref:Tetratricopeptide repeat protein n=1 Tax=Flavobacterium croceum DSM 17960 TaxID=1121886 RepID=A0A2S4NAQ4_9FLAO|nr:hypothetical protein [Flavobacterium croceum]POS02772.1 hypothetical protein Q361_10285 [Flavobacterium croceum DSM 17960]